MFKIGSGLVLASMGNQSPLVSDAAFNKSNQRHQMMLIISRFVQCGFKSIKYAFN